jgi:plasmid stabilization system protein ParE
MKRLSWTRQALSDVSRLSGFIREKNPGAARRAADTIREGVKILRDNAEIGRPACSAGPETREWLIRFGASVYVVRYRVQGQTVLLLKIRHGLEDDPKS